MTRETIPSTDVVENIEQKPSDSRRRTLATIAGGVVIASAIGLGVAGAVKYASRESLPCEKTWDIEPDNSSSAMGEVTLPSGKRLIMSVNSYVDRQETGQKKAVPMVQISLGGAENYGKQTFVIDDRPGPDATFNLESGYEFYASATEDEVTTWCSKNAAATTPQH